MIIVLKPGCLDSQKKEIKDFLTSNGYKIKEIVGEQETVLGAVGNPTVDINEVELLSGVEQVVPISKPYKLASRQLQKDDSIFQIGNISIGANRVVVIAGPPLVESKEQIFEIADGIYKSGAAMISAATFLPGISPYAFEGLKEEGLIYLKDAATTYGLPVVSEVTDLNYFSLMHEYADILVVSQRNMQNFELLKALGESKKPIILKRGFGSTLEEFLLSAEYLLLNGNEKVILCESGIPSFDSLATSVLDLTTCNRLKKVTHLPVIVDPTRAATNRDGIIPLSLAAICAGACGLTIDVQLNSSHGNTHDAQSLYLDQFEKLMRDIQVLAPVVSKEVVLPEKSYNYITINDNKNEKAISPLSVSYQGEVGAYAHIAALNHFGNSYKFINYTDGFKSVFNSVLSKESEFGIIPIENSLAGSVLENYSLLQLYPDITIVGEVKVRIQHNLIAKKQIPLSSIKTIYSHQQALWQSAAFIEKLEKDSGHKIQLKSVASTSLAVKNISESFLENEAAIGSSDAANLYNCTILKSAIETNPNNYTRFFIIQKGVPVLDSSKTKATIYFNLKNSPGTLAKALLSFANYGFNMVKLESRPILGKPFEYQFYCDVELSCDQEKIFDVLKEIELYSNEVRVIGFYKGIIR